MSSKYRGEIEFVRVVKHEDGSTSREIAFGPREFEVTADSASDARDKVQEQALSRYGAGRGPSDVLSVTKVYPLERREQRFFGFSYEHEGEHTVRHRGAITNQDYEPGHLYAFQTTAERDEWVNATPVGELRRPVKVSALPKGWSADKALDTETDRPYWESWGTRW